jgi:hypothetical protein
MIEVKAMAATPMAMTTSVKLKADCSRKGRKGQKGFFFWSEKSFGNVADLA